MRRRKKRRRPLLRTGAERVSRLLKAKVTNESTEGKSVSAAVDDDQRPCTDCGNPVTNETLGSYGGKSALSGPLRCVRCADRADAEAYDRHKRQEEFKAAQAKVNEAAKAEVAAILVEFNHIDSLLVKSRATLTTLRSDPSSTGAQRKLILLSRECTRDISILLHGFKQRHW